VSFLFPWFEREEARHAVLRGIRVMMHDSIEARRRPEAASEANPPLASAFEPPPRLVVVAGARHFHWADLLVEIVLFGVGLLAHLLAAVAEDVGQTG